MPPEGLQYKHTKAEQETQRSGLGMNAARGGLRFQNLSKKKMAKKCRFGMGCLWRERFVLQPAFCPFKTGGGKSHTKAGP